MSTSSRCRIRVFTFDRGNTLLYGDDGLVVNPVAATQVGNFVSSGAMVPDSLIGNAYFVGQPSSQNGTVGYLVQSFNISALHAGFHSVLV